MNVTAALMLYFTADKNKDIKAKLPLNTLAAV